MTVAFPVHAPRLPPAPMSSPPTPHHRSRRVVLILLAVLVAAYLAITAIFFVAPPAGSVRHPQAVVVLGGYGNRVAAGVRLAQERHVGTVVLSTTARDCAPRIAGITLICFVPRPLTTQGEGRAIRRLARAHHWDRLLVVAGTTQITRAKLRIDRCYTGAVAFAGVDPSGVLGWVHYIAYDEAAMVKALVLQPGC